MHLDKSLLEITSIFEYNIVTQVYLQKKKNKSIFNTHQDS